MDLSRSIEKPDTLAIYNKVISITAPSLDSPTSKSAAATPTSQDELTAKTPSTDDKPRNQQTPTITEENEVDDNSHKSCLSLPVEPPPSGMPIEKDRRKLSVQGLMAFAERRRSSSTFADMRKMSFSNGDMISIRSPGGVGKYREMLT